MQVLDMASNLPEGMEIWKETVLLQVASSAVKVSRMQPCELPARQTQQWPQQELQGSAGFWAVPEGLSKTNTQQQDFAQQRDSSDEQQQPQQEEQQQQQQHGPVPTEDGRSV
jgi:hypothetical protein